MISWIQKYFQHHFRIIFAVLLAVTIISFIFTIGASPGIGRAAAAIVSPVGRISLPALRVPLGPQPFLM